MRNPQGWQQDGNMGGAAPTPSSRQMFRWLAPVGAPPTDGHFHFLDKGPVLPGFLISEAESVWVGKRRKLPMSGSGSGPDPLVATLGVLACSLLSLGRAVGVCGEADVGCGFWSSAAWEIRS